MSEPIPPRLETERLVLRCWRPDDAPLLRTAIDASLEHLRAWMPWAMDEPSSLEDTRERLRGHQAAFEAGEDFVFAILSPDESEVLGGSGLHPRVGEGALEIGYWIRADRLRAGLATEAARALTEAALRAPGIERVQIQCDPDNAVSRRVAERLGYRRVETRRGDKRTPSGALRDTMVFEQRRAWMGVASGPCDALQGQIGAALAMLRRAIEACPPGLWERPSEGMGFWYMAYHALFYVDHDLHPADAPFASPAFDRFEYEMTVAPPPYEHPYAKGDLLAYLELCLDKAQDVLRAIARGESPELRGGLRVGVGAFEVVLYQLRHVQHHTAQLNALLRLEGVEPPRWVRRGDGIPLEG